MLPATENLSLYRGDSVRLERRLRSVDAEGVSGDYFDLTGCTPKAQIRATAASADVLIEFDAELTDQTTTPGGVVLSIDAGLTGSLADKTLWDFQLTHPDGAVRTYLSGDVTAKGQVTR